MSVKKIYNKVRRTENLKDVTKYKTIRTDLKNMDELENIKFIFQSCSNSIDEIVSYYFKLLENTNKKRHVNIVTI